MNRKTPWWAALLALLLPFAAAAQQEGLEIDVVGGNAAALPIAAVFIGASLSGSWNGVSAATADWSTTPRHSLGER
mgnify:CR=1 FL=1